MARLARFSLQMGVGMRENRTGLNVFSYHV